MVSFKSMFIVHSCSPRSLSSTMSKCHIPACGSTLIPKKKRGQGQENEANRISFHRFPINEKLRRKWLKFFGQKVSLDTRDYFVCSRHFPVDAFEHYDLLGENMQRRRLRKGGNKINKIIWFNF